MLGAAYFTTLKGLWDELLSYNDLPICLCGAMKKIEELDKGTRHAISYGLNNSYFAIHGYIFHMQSISIIGRVHSIILHEVQQRDMFIPNKSWFIKKQLP